MAYESPLWFSLHYLRHHFGYPLAPFHIELFHILQSPEYELIAIMAFRESGKSTIMNTANVLWSILGKPQKRFVIIVSKTQEQAKSHFANVKAELEQNELLKSDFGPFIETKDEWNKLSLELEYHGAKIMSVTREQSVRGLKYGQYRPDLIICDDLEDISTTTDRRESEVLLHRFSTEIVPLGGVKTRVIILGNLLSETSFLMRIKEQITNGELAGIFRAYPLLDAQDSVLWPGKFPDQKSIEKLQKKLSSRTWSREYLLDLIDRPTNTTHDEDDWAQKYEDELQLIAHEYMRNFLKEKERMFQIPLIEPMRRFQILIPSHISEDPVQDERYQQYEKDVRRVAEEYEDELARQLSQKITKH